jgi:hypothetical protein
LEAIRFDKLTNRRVDHATKIRTAWIIPFTAANFLSLRGRQQIPKCSIEQAEEGICEASLPLWIYKAR